MAARTAKKTSKPTPKKSAPKAAKKAIKDSAPEVLAADSAAGAAQGAMNKTDFVMSQPAGLTPKQVAAAAAAAGIDISAKYVSNIRSSAKAGSKKPTGKAAKKAPGMAAKKAPAAPRKPASVASTLSKSDFIRLHGPDVKPAEVVRRAAEAGLTMTAGLVNTVRGQDKKRKAVASAPTTRLGSAPMAALAAAPAAPTPAPSVASGSSGRERELVSLALDVGLARALELLSDIKARVAALL